MNSTFNNQQAYERAQKRVKEIKGFYAHLASYCLVIPVIIFVNLRFTPGFHWFWFSTLGWGLGLFFHWLGIFGFQLLGLGKDWEERKIREFMNQNNN
ncbi:2TM domain-containing protein [Polaribacter gangjinensis]|uniref:Histidine kinase n=1 Tax=Polaribacter gangjinensis TaxID=574710 RepID=A0A2S7W9Q4_9FLAO|nr:2TM domain-containing protein [Polaribacter gangjinensis]PQJ74323.1 histidine kinase [Polaribacter gangjinensis]